MKMSKRLSAAEKSALFSNLSKGCEKQYRPEEAGLFSELAKYYAGRVKTLEKTSLETLNDLLQKDLVEYGESKQVVSDEGDRGSLRAFVWGEKVSKIAASILSRFMKDGNKLLEDTNIHVCEICGFIYLGDKLPEVCPVCKVPGFKISKVRRR